MEPMKLYTTLGKFFVACSVGMLGLYFWAHKAANEVMKEVRTTEDTTSAAVIEEDGSNSRLVAYFAGKAAGDLVRIKGMKPISFWVQVASIPYFLFSVFIFYVVARHAGWLHWLAVGVSLTMLIWTLLLGSLLQIDEELPVPAVVAIFLGFLAVMALVGFYEEYEEVAKTLKTSGS